MLKRKWTHQTHPTVQSSHCFTLYILNTSSGWLFFPAMIHNGFLGTQTKFEAWLTNGVQKLNLFNGSDSKHTEPFNVSEVKKPSQLLTQVKFDIVDGTRFHIIYTPHHTLPLKAIHVYLWFCGAIRLFQSHIQL